MELSRRGARPIAMRVVILALALGCGRERATGRDSSAAAVGGVPAATSSGGAITKPACPATGHWSPCQVRTRLDRSGVVPRDSTLSDLPALGVRPTTYVVGTAGLAVYLFADSTARARAARTLDTTRYVPPSAALGMGRQATVIENDNLLALLFTQREQQRERVADALQAGAPQP
jgi:hypothetical protein